jgi:acetyltransferase-like isoleucine patch superfamily enzyme
VLGIRTRFLRALAVRDRTWDRRYLRLYRGLNQPEGDEWAEILRERGDFYSMGKDCYIDAYALIEDRQYIRIGNNVRINRCMMMCHEGSANMVNRALGLSLESVGKIDILDNVYIGYGAVILPGVTIGPNAIVSVGSVVRADVPEGDVVAGVPAKRVGRFQMSAEMLQAKYLKYPWREVLESRNENNLEEIEQELIRMRQVYFYGAPAEPRQL